MSDTQINEARKKADGIPIFRDTGDFLLNDFSAEELGGLIRAVYKYAKDGEKTAFKDRGMKLMYYLLCRDFDEFYGIAEPRCFEDIGGEDDLEPPSLPQKKPLCDTCKHAIDGVVDDFAAVFCGARQGYFGQVTECEKYERNAKNG